MSRRYFMQIKDLAHCSGLSIDTIRYYEKLGVLDKQFITRLDNNYREYDTAVVGQLQLVKEAQAAGFTLSQIRALAKVWQNGELTNQEKYDLFEAKVQEITQRITQLTSIKTYLLEKIAGLNITN